MIKKVGTIVNYNILSYLIGEGLKSVLRNKKSTFAALIIMFATMVTVGIGIAGAKNITSMIKQLEGDVAVTQGHSQCGRAPVRTLSAPDLRASPVPSPGSAPPSPVRGEGCWPPWPTWHWGSESWCIQYTQPTRHIH